MQKNEIYTTEITGCGNEGEGVAHIGGIVVFVPNTLVGETVEVKILKVLKNYAYGRLERIIVPSPMRQKPECAVYEKCGGCALQHTSYEYELDFKTQKVKDALKRIGGLAVQVESCVPSLRQFRYRNKALFAVTPDGVGFFSPRSHRLTEADGCIIQNEVNAGIIAAVKDYMTKYRVSAYDEQTGCGTVRNIFSRTVSGGIMVCIVVTKKRLPGTDYLINKLTEAGALSIYLNINSRRTNVALGDENILLFGDAFVTDTLCGLQFCISPMSFYQIISLQTAALYNEAIAIADIKSTDSVVDLYCGIGTISLFAAKHANMVTGVEIVPDAVENAKANAKLNGIENVEFICGKAEDIAESLESPDVLFIDPPRKGCDEKLIFAIEKIQPKKIVYISCNPATLARDLKLLCGYTVRRVKPFDMFPRTFHVETVVLLSRKRPDDKIEIDLDLDEVDITSAESKATYDELKAYVLEKYNLKVSNLYISQVKRKLGLEVGKNYNLPKSENPTVPTCPPEKETAITQALRHFGMIN